MNQTLELFVQKNDLYLVVTKTVEEKTELVIQKNEKARRSRTREVRWAYSLNPPILMRTLRVKHTSGNSSFILSKGATRKKARGSLIKIIRGGILEYSNSFDRQCGDDPQIKVPKNLR